MIESWKQSGLVAAVVIAAIIVGAGLQAWSLEHNRVSPAPEPLATATPSTTGPATSANTPPSGPVQVPSTLKVIDVRSGAATTLYQSGDQAAYGARFVDDIVEVFAQGAVLRLHLDGSTALPAQDHFPCRMNNGNAEIAGQVYPGLQCGVTSPNGRWMTYTRAAGETTLPSGYRVPLWDEGVMFLLTGEARDLQTGLVDCGGCDGRYGPIWSPTSRYVVYAETGGDQRRFLSDVTTGTTRVIGRGAQVSDAPVWLPFARGNQLVYPPDRAGSIARLENLDAGTSTDLPIPWPVRFDSTGRLMYSPAWDTDPKSGTGSTTIFDLAAGKVIATLSGVPPERFLWNDSRAVALHNGGYVAVLQRANGCDGTAIYVQGVAKPGCVPGGAEGQISPDGSAVAVARVEGSTGLAYGPGFQAMSMTRYSITVVDSTTATGPTLLTDVISYGSDARGAFPYGPPLMLWDLPGTHLLVLWPYRLGL